ncbi:MAG: hypothetical protein LBI26_00935 [Holosporales bacterium]|jgi:hypothetical protein|nr:hypothetical protein [Holosporales bacterium]
MSSLKKILILSGISLCVLSNNISYASSESSAAIEREGGGGMNPFATVLEHI